MTLPIKDELRGIIQRFGGRRVRSVRLGSDLYDRWILHLDRTTPNNPLVPWPAPPGATTCLDGVPIMFDPDLAPYDFAPDCEPAP